MKTIASNLWAFSESNFVPNKQEIPTLNGLRGIAVLLVLFSHIPEEGKVLEALNFVFQPGYLGIDIFFVLSGFLITRILLFERINRKPLKNFLVRRLLRIFPIYYLTLFLLLLLAPDASLPWCFLYVSNYYFAFNTEVLPLEHTWSLAVEEQFYLIWPFLIFLISLQKIRNIILYFVLPLAFLFAVVTAYFEPTYDYQADHVIFRLTIYRVFSLGAGALIALYEQQIREHAGNVLTVFAVTFFISIIILPFAIIVEHQWIGPVMLLGFGTLSVSILLISIYANDYFPLLRKLLCSQILTFMGKTSYGIYLYHVPIFFFLGVYHYDPVSPPSWARVFLALSMSIIFAAFSYQFIERPILKLKDKFA